jgi:antitoxin VapB
MTAKRVFLALRQQRLHLQPHLVRNKKVARNFDSNNRLRYSTHTSIISPTEIGSKQLSELTGENITTAVTTAVRERLERSQPKSREGMSERLMAIAKETGPLMKNGLKSTDIGDFLYDEYGLPK